MSRRGVLFFLLRWCPALRWRELGLGVGTEEGNSSPSWCWSLVEVTSRRESSQAVDAVRAGVPVRGEEGGPSRSGGEAPVMGVERRGVRRDKPAWRRRWKSSTSKV